MRLMLYVVVFKTIICCRWSFQMMVYAVVFQNNSAHGCVSHWWCRPTWLCFRPMLYAVVFQNDGVCSCVFYCCCAWLCFRSMVCGVVFQNDGVHGCVLYCYCAWMCFWLMVYVVAFRQVLYAVAERGCLSDRVCTRLCFRLMVYGIIHWPPKSHCPQGGSTLLLSSDTAVYKENEWTYILNLTSLCCSVCAGLTYPYTK